jgi:hypothetical protein
MAIEQARELGRLAKQQRQAGEQDAALETLRDAQRALEAELTGGNDAAAPALADTLGQIGGTLREQDELVAAASAYDAGYAVESQYALPSTYNALNRVVTRILLCPDSLADPEALRRYDELPWIDVGAEAARLHDVFAAREGGDQWTVGDAALTAALTGIDGEVDQLALEPSVRDSYRPIVERLARLDTPRRANLARLARALGDTG